MSGSAEYDFAVAIFAHNEEDRIAQCLRMVVSAIDDVRALVVVLANGCRDRTVAVAQTFTKDRPNIHVADIPLGDKANAWNHYVYERAPKARYHFFVDGDIRPTPISFKEICEALERDRYAHAGSALPQGGRRAAAWRERVLANHGMPGGFYCIRNGFLHRLRQAEVRLPIGLIGDDALVPILVKTDLLEHSFLDPNRVIPCRNASFLYSSLSYWQPKDWHLYWRRRVRYSLRHFQNRLLIPRLKAHGLKGLPTHVNELYALPEASKLTARWRVPDLIFDRIALARIAKSQP